MNQKNLMIGLCLLFSVWMTGCSRESGSTSPGQTSDFSSPSSTRNDTHTLTTERAQTAIDRFMAANATGTMKIKGGIREIPSENSAVAEVTMENFRSNDGRFYPQTLRGRSLSWSTGAVVFSRYTDGKWVLSQIVIVNDSSGQRVTYKPNIEVY